MKALASLLRYPNMYPALVVLWLGTPAPPAEPPPEVDHWAAERGYRAVSLPTTAEPPYPEDVALEIERLLEEARSLAPGAAQLERIDQLLQLHPELPQAGWWLAERHALQRQQAEPAAATQLELQRAALEGARAETAGAGAAEPRTAAPSLILEPSGLRPRDQLVLDGEPTSAGARVAPGRHHVQLLRAQRRVWAGWIELDSAQLPLPEASAACTELDLLGTEYASEAPRPAAGVRCPVWAVAHTRAGHLQLSLCRADRCEPWQARGSVASSQAAPVPRHDPEPAAQLPAWLSWGALGLGAAVSTALVLWQAGVFDRPAPATEFVFTGPSAAAVRF